MKRVDLQEYVGPTPDGEPLFVFEGCAIEDPWLSECKRFEVDPVKYYGKDFLDILTNEQIRSLIDAGEVDESDVVYAYNNEWWEDIP